ncbi:hypothetical protein Pen02_05320 [Plantactinospora endophytica]|uniref:Uncharacterized protein n=1 Tax=Plantactinospora endophytica TaxID=673535 RepID=A0ABQ4DT15_9ACTN|nr:hypothetical protein Pen02_05320 [Plantactinospora endophytica]
MAELSTLGRASLAVPVLVIGRDVVLSSGTVVASILRPMGGLRWFPRGIRMFMGRPDRREPECAAGVTGYGGYP